VSGNDHWDDQHIRNQTRYLIAASAVLACGVAWVLYLALR